MKTPEQKAKDREKVRRWRAQRPRIDYFPSPEALAIIEAERDDDGESCYSYSDVLDEIVRKWKTLTCFWTASNSNGVDKWVHSKKHK